MYRLLNVNDGHEYAALVHDAYQADGELGIDFAAVTLPEEKLIRGLILNPTYGLFIEGRLVSAITLRMPWVKKPGPYGVPHGRPLPIAAECMKPGPYGVPHLGWVSTRPEEKHKGYARKLFFLLEEQVLKEELRTPAVTLGTAAEHPWLVKMYESWGFETVETKTLPGNSHQTVYMKKSYL